MIRKAASLLLLLSLGHGAVAQKLGVQGGLLAAWQQSRSGAGSESSSPRMGWKAGFVSDLGGGGFIGLLSQLSIVSKSYRSSDAWGSTRVSATFAEMAVPLVLRHRGSFAGAGTVISIGLGGSYKKEGGGLLSRGAVQFDGNGAGSAEAVHLNPVEGGIFFTAGHRFRKGLLLHADYNLGITNMYPGTAGNRPSVMSRYLSVSAGKFF